MKQWFTIQNIYGSRKKEREGLRYAVDVKVTLSWQINSNCDSIKNIRRSKSFSHGLLKKRAITTHNFLEGVVIAYRFIFPGGVFAKKRDYLISLITLNLAF